jgi:hypothetical protein
VPSANGRSEPGGSGGIAKSQTEPGIENEPELAVAVDGPPTVDVGPVVEGLVAVTTELVAVAPEVGADPAVALATVVVPAGLVWGAVGGAGLMQAAASTVTANAANRRPIARMIAVLDQVTPWT